MAPALIAAFADPTVTAALAAVVGPMVTAAVGPAVTAAVGPAVATALAPFETKVAQAFNRASLSQGSVDASLMPLPQPVTGAVPQGFPQDKYQFESLSRPPFTQAKLDTMYR